MISRTPHGVRELKRAVIKTYLEDVESRTPHGVRELKPHDAERAERPKAVAPHTGCVN